MGDLIKKNKFKERENNLIIEEKSVVKKIAKNKVPKNKMISASVTAENYANFTKINKARGMSNNSALNMLIADYINKNQE